MVETTVFPLSNVELCCICFGFFVLNVSDGETKNKAEKRRRKPRSEPAQTVGRRKKVARPKDRRRRKKDINKSKGNKRVRERILQGKAIVKLINYCNYK